MTGFEFDPWGKGGGVEEYVPPPWDDEPPEPGTEPPADLYALPPYDDRSTEVAPDGYWNRLVAGGAFILDTPPDPSPIWGTGSAILWSSGEPCIVTGPIGVGKTTIVGRLVRGRLGLDRQLLGYGITRGDRRVLYLACDRPRQIARNLARMMRPEDRDVLDDRLVVWKGPPPTDLARTTSFLLDMCHKADADTVVIDGLKDVALKLTDDEVGAGLNQAFQRCVAEGIEVVANHHQRKSTNGTPTKPKTLADLYGSTWIGAGAGTVVLAWADAAGSPTIEISTLKPAHENVGPISVLHNLTAGTLEVVDALRLEDVLRAADMPRSIAELAAALGIPELDKARRESLRRQLRDLERTHGLDVLEVPSPTGGRPETRWSWRTG